MAIPYNDPFKSFTDQVSGEYGPLAGQARTQEGLINLAMASKRIQMEHEAQLRYGPQTAQAMQEATATTPEQLGALKGIATGKPTNEDMLGPLRTAFPKGIPAEQAKEALTLSGIISKAQSSANKPIHVVSKADHNNLVASGFQLPQTGEYIRPPEITLDPNAQKEINKVDMMTGNAQNMLKGLLDRAKTILPNAPTGVPLNKLNSYWQQHGMPTNPDLKSYIDTTNTLKAQYTKDTTGMAPRSLELIKLEGAAFPDATTDDFATATKKVNIMNDTMTDKASTAHTIYDPTNFLKSPFHRTAQAQQSQQLPKVNLDAVLARARDIQAQRMGKPNGK